MKIKYIIPLFITFLVGCNLDREPQDKIFSENFWKTQDDASRSLMGCYSYLPNGVGDAYKDAFADNSYCQYPWEGKATIVSAGDINDGDNFGYGFGGVRRFNYFLANIDRVPMPEALKNQYKAEVRTLRAWTYFNLITTFGDVPLFKNYITEAEEARVAPTPENEIVEFIIKELEESIANLPAMPSVKSRIGKATAYTIKARVHLFYGQYQQVTEATKAIMDMGSYQLFEVSALTDDDLKDDYSTFVTFKDDADKEKFYKGLRSYEKLFWEENKNNSEVILSEEFIEDNFNWLARRLLPDNVGGGWSSVTPTIELVDSYWNYDGTKFTPPSVADRAARYNKGNYTPDYLNEFKNRDTRLYASILFPGAIWNAAIGNDTFVWQNNGKAGNTSKVGYNYRKMVEPQGDIGRKLNDFPIIRYAEILLMYAEAKNEISGAETSVYQAINKIRSRAGMPNVTENLSKEQMREIIRNERRIELANEGHRWNDIRRWNISSEVMKTINNINGELAQKRRWEDKFKKMPYPISAIDRNPKLKEAQQAKGY